MKSLLATLSVLAIVLLLLIYILSKVSGAPEKTESAGVDQSKPSSSYEQKTNHFPKTPYSLGPIQGSESPYQVNQWASYQV